MRTPHIELVVHIAISALRGTHLYLSQVKHVRENALPQNTNTKTMSQRWKGRNIFSLKSAQAGFKPARHAAQLQNTTL